MLFILLFSIIPLEPPITDRFDVAEVNHFHDEWGRLVFDQIIWRNFDERSGRERVVAWRLLKCVEQIPAYDFKRGDWVSVWHDGEVLREVRALSCRETRTQHDPELIDREFFPKEDRPDLSKRSERSVIHRKR